MRSSHLFRVALALGATALALAGVEGGLRAVYPTLPSHAALEGSTWRVDVLSEAHHPAFDLETLSGRCAEDMGLVSSTGLSSRHGQTGADPLELWTLGDSVVAGAEVEPHQAFPVLLGEGLAQAGREVKVDNLAVPGSSLCGRARLLAALAAKPERPDLMLVVFGSDDMDDYRLFAYRDRMVVPADPATIGNPVLAAAVSRSYLANLAWFT